MWARKSPQIAEVLPLLYLHGLSSGDFIPALEQFLGASHGLSSATVTRLTEQWRDDAKRFGQRSLRKLPRQGHTAELDSAGAVGRGRKRVGGTSPSASCGRSSL